MTEYKPPVNIQGLSLITQFLHFEKEAGVEGLVARGSDLNNFSLNVHGNGSRIITMFMTEQQVATVVLRALTTLKLQTGKDYVLCEKCAKAFSKDETEHLGYGGYDVCAECFDKHVETCVVCGTPDLDSQMEHNGSGEAMCQDCYNNQALTKEEYQEIEAERRFEEKRVGL